MTDTELSRLLNKEGYGTELLIIDDNGNEFDVDGVVTTMAGQYHLVLKLKTVPFEEHFFRTLEQSIEDKRKEIDYYSSKVFEEKCIDMGDKGLELLDYYRTKEIPRLKKIIEMYKEKLSNEN